MSYLNGTWIEIRTAHGADGKFTSGSSNSGNAGHHDFSKHSHQALAQAYHAESKAGGMWTARGDGKHGKSDRMEAILKELKKRLPKGHKTTIDDLNRWAAGHPLPKRHLPEG